MSGWFRIHRGWRDCDVFEDEPMTEREAWLWLIEHAAWKPLSRTTAKGERVSVQRGQLHVSLRALGTAFGWGKNKVSRFLDRLQAAKMVDQSTGQSGSILTICNYAIYQDAKEEGGTASGTAAGQPRDTHKEGKEDSVPDGTADPAKQLFDLGVQVLTSTGTPADRARSIVGRWRKEFGTGETIAALLDAKARGISQPVEWIPKRLQSSGPTPSNYFAEVARRHERRAA
jgi:hypothetical protein